MKKHLLNIEKEVAQLFQQNLQPKGEFSFVAFTKRLSEILASSKEHDYFNASLQKLNPGIEYCGASIKFGELSFECFDCAVDENALLCPTCFKSGSHANHRIRYSTRKAGYCDCGDASMVKIEAACQAHQRSSMMLEEQADASKTRDFESIATVLLESLFMNIIGVSEAMEVSQRTDKKLTKTAINNLAFHSLTFIINNFKGQIGLSLLSTVLVGKFLCVETGKMLRHECESPELITIKSGKNSKACSCAILEALLRAFFTFDSHVVNELKKLIHKLLPKWEFKLAFIEVYAKSFSVIFGGRKEVGGELKISPFYAFYNYFSNEKLVEKFLNSFDFPNTLIDVTGEAIDAFFGIYFIAAYNGFNEIKKLYTFLTKYQAFSACLAKTAFLERFLEVIYKSHDPSVGEVEEDNEKCRLHIECSLLVMFRNMLSIVYEWQEPERSQKFESLFRQSIRFIEKANSSETPPKLQNAWPLHSTLERAFTILLCTMLSYRSLSDVKGLFLSCLNGDPAVLEKLFQIFLGKITKALRFCKKIVKRANTNELFDNPVESIKREVINGFYKKSYYLQYDYDMALYQIILCLVQPQQVLAFFSRTYDLELKQIFFKTNDEAYVQALNEALNSMVILLSDETPYMNSIAYLKILTRPNSSVLSEYLKENLKALIISAMHLPKTTDLKGVKHLLFNKIINYDVEIEGVLEEVAIFNKDNKSFKLRPEFVEIFEPYTFHKYPKLTSELYESIKLLSAKNQELDTIIGNPFQRSNSGFFLSALKKNLFESEFPRYLALVLKIDSFTQKMSENLKHTVKLIAIFLNFSREIALSQPLKELENNTVIKNVKTYFLVKDFPAKLNSLTKIKPLADLRPSFAIILKKLDELGRMLEPTDNSKMTPAELELKLSASVSDNQMKIEGAGDSYAKRKQERIKKQFQEKQNLFLQKNNINVENLSEEAVCYFCHGDMQDPKEAFGVYCYVTEDNLIDYCQKNERGLRSLRPKGGPAGPSSKTPTLSLTSCMHFIHKSCGEKSLANNIKIINEKKYLFSSITESLCGSCRCLSNIFLSIVEDKFEFTSYRTFPEGSQPREKLIADSFINFLRQGNKPQPSRPPKYLIPANSKAFWEGCAEFFDMLLRHFIMTEEYSYCLAEEDFILNVVQNMLGVTADNITLSGVMCFLRKDRTLYRNLYLLYAEYFWNFRPSQDTSKKSSPNKLEKQPTGNGPEKMVSESGPGEGFLLKKLEEKLRVLFVRGDLRDVIDIDEFDRIFHRALWEVAIYLKEDEEHKYRAMALLSRHVYKLMLAYYCFVHTPDETSKNLEIFHNLLKLKEDFQILVAANMIHFSRRVLGVFLTCFRVDEKELFNALDPDNFGSDLEELQHHINILPGVFELNFEGDFDNEALSEWINKLFIMKKMHNLAKENLLTAYALNLHLLPLAKNFADFHYKYVQELCKMCAGFPVHGDAYICLICEELLCSVRCSKASGEPEASGNLNTHANSAHSGKGVFMNIQTALVIIVGTPKCIAFTHIYKDQYNQSINSQRNADFKKYNLDFKLYNRLQDIVIHKRIPQEICYRLMDTKDCMIKQGFL